MQVYLFRAALYCKHCGDILCAELPRPAFIDDESTYDSDEYPKGPYCNGGGESDSPQHCDDCGVFLENPLTDEGRRFVESIYTRNGHTKKWHDFYGITPPPR